MSEGKPNLALLPPAGKLHAAMALEHGDEKYGAFDWRKKKVSALAYIAKAERHIDNWNDGEEFTTDSNGKVHNLGGAIACLMIILDAMELDCLIDDRPVPGCSSVLQGILMARKAGIDPHAPLSYWKNREGDNKTPFLIELLCPECLALSNEASKLSFKAFKTCRECTKALSDAGTCSIFTTEYLRETAR